jgi:23S rRNA (guanine2445-N2)-methyltransferase / 23S rRNA (guanine2069-N7)-methyltransferase
MTTDARFAATCPKGIESLLADELRALGASDVRETRSAVTFAGPLPIAYRVCLWSRFASRILMQLAEFPAATADELYTGVHAVPWEEHVVSDGTLAVDAVGTTAGLTHTGFAAQKVKDAVVDRLRERTGERPSVDLERPDVRLNLRLYREQATLSLDPSGDPLHRRGYRTPGEQVEAPLKENLAAAIIARAGWPEIAARGGSLFDPMCGSGTLLVEGALMATDRAPGLLRGYWGFDGWLGHDADAWEALLDEADERAEAGDASLPAMAGSDVDPTAAEIARGCLKRAGFGTRVAVEVGGVDDMRPPPAASPGLVVTNPPFGVRLGETAQLAGLYSKLGERLSAGFDGWRAAVFTAEPDLARATGLRSYKSYSLFNGAVPTKLYLFEMSPGNVWREV